MTRGRSAAVSILGCRAAALAVVCALVFPLPASGGSGASPSLAMEEVAVYGSGDSPERLHAPVPRPVHAAIPVHVDFLRARILAPISPWENDDDNGCTGADGAARDGRD